LILLDAGREPHRRLFCGGLLQQPRSRLVPTVERDEILMASCIFRELVMVARVFTEGLHKHEPHWSMLQRQRNDLRQTVEEPGTRPNGQVAND